MAGAFLTIYPYPLTNLSVTASGIDAYNIIDGGSYYRVELLKDPVLTISADGYESQTITVSGNTTITLTQIIQEVSKLSNGTDIYTIKDAEARTSLANKQDTLVSGTNIKTVGGTSLLGSGDVAFPTVDQTYSGTSVNAQSGVAVKSAIDAAISSVYKPGGSVAFASLPTPGSTNEGYVYNVTDAFTTTADFVEGAGINYPAGTNVVIVNVGSSSYKYDTLTGAFQPLLVSGTNIKTINNESILGSGNIEISYTAGNYIDITNDVISGKVSTNSNLIVQPASQNTYYAWYSSYDDIYVYTLSATPSVGDKVYTYNTSMVEAGEVTYVSGNVITPDFTRDCTRDSSNDMIYPSAEPSDDYAPSQKAVKTYADNLVTNMQTTSNLVTSVSSSSTDTQYPSAKCVYDIVGDIETLLQGV